MTTESPAPAASGGGAGKGGGRRRRGPFGRIGLLYRQVMGELRKVIWPTRHELISYTTVVLVFVAVMVGLVALLDFGFVKAVGRLFG
jgi:preprotein translocase subunit SecE